MDVTSRSVPAHSLSLSLFHNDPASLAASLPLGVGTSDHPPTRLNPLSEASEAFFDKVFVMAEEPELRRNRMSLLNAIATLPKGIVDFTELPGF